MCGISCLNINRYLYKIYMHISLCPDSSTRGRIGSHKQKIIPYAVRASLRKSNSRWNLKFHALQQNHEGRRSYRRIPPLKNCNFYYLSCDDSSLSSLDESLTIFEQ